MFSYNYKTIKRFHIISGLVLLFYIVVFYNFPFCRQGISGMHKT